MKEVFSSASITTSSIAYDPFNKLIEIPKSPKERYKIMTSEMPKGGKLSLDMMYKTAGIQINYDYNLFHNLSLFQRVLIDREWSELVKYKTKKLKHVNFCYFISYINIIHMNHHFLNNIIF